MVTETSECAFPARAVPVAPSLVPESVLRARPLLEVDKVALRLSASPEFVRRLIRAGELPAVRIGKRYRVEPRDLQAFIDKRRTMPIEAR